jgi:hypothetical protein
MKRAIAAIAAALGASGLACAGSPHALSRMGYEELKQQPTSALLYACEHASRRSFLVIEELRRRDDITVMDARRCPPLLPEFVWRKQIRARHIPDIQDGVVRVGMNEAEMRLARGEPLRSRHVGEYTEHVYGLAGPYVYTQNGVVTGFKN